MALKRTGLAHFLRGRPLRIFHGLLLAGLIEALAVAAFGAGAPRMDFELPPGDAATTLKTFSRQSGDEIIYLADQVRALKTKGISGKLTPREALDRMLDGSGLIAIQDERTGAFAIRQNSGPAPLTPPPRPAVAPGPDRIIMLPPIFVEKSQLSTPRWRYTKLPGMEFLSCCDDETTAQLIERVYHLNQRLEAFLPAEFRVRLAVPTTFVLYDEKQHPVDFKEMMAGVRHLDGEAGGPDTTTVRYLPNFRFSERDELAVFYIPQDSIQGGGDIHLNEGFIRSLMGNRTPPLPPWFVEGMMALYQSSPLEVEPLYLERYFTAASEDLTATKFPYGSAVIRLPSAMFGSETKRLADLEPGWEAKLLSVAALFASPPPRDHALPGAENNGTGAGEMTPGYIRWRSQAALFIHWALNNDDGRSRAAFWTFVEQASVAPVTEAMFKACFGSGYGEMDHVLAEYLPGAIRTHIRLYSDVLPELAPVTLRMATDAEISRIKGNLERLEVAYVRKRLPALTPKYLAQTRHTLHRAYDRGARDPGLLEVMGLCECDAGEDASARPFLEAAVKGGAVRPRTYYELARIYYQLFRAKDRALWLNTKQTAGLLQLLLKARTQSPPLPEVYEFIAAIWQQSSVPLHREDLAVLDEGILFFPENLRLLYATAALETTHGFAGDAGRLIKRGLQLAPDGPDRTQFLKLQSASAGGYKAAR